MMRKPVKLGLLGLVAFILAASCTNPVMASLSREALYKDWFYDASVNLVSVRGAASAEFSKALFLSSDTIGLSLTDGWEFMKANAEGIYGTRTSHLTSGTYACTIEKSELLGGELWMWAKGDNPIPFYGIYRLSKDGKTLTANFKDSGYATIDEAFVADIVSGPLTLHQ